MQDGHEFRHLRHLHSAREHEPDAAADDERAGQQRIIIGDLAEHSGQQGDGHARDAVPVTAARRFLVRQAAERKNEQYARRDVRDGNDAWTEHGDLLPEHVEHAARNRETAGDIHGRY